MSKGKNKEYVLYEEKNQQGTDDESGQSHRREGTQGRGEVMRQEESFS